MYTGIEIAKNLAAVAKMKADVDIKLADEYLEEGMEEILDIVNEIDAAMELQIDVNEEKIC